MPPLNQLRAFEAAARHLSFKDAADELNVTHAAVSHQIKKLEEFLGIPLFVRLTRQVRLTDAAAAFADNLKEPFDAIDEAASKLIGGNMKGTLNISVPPFFGNRWLLPRLEKFHTKFPGLTVKANLSFDLVNFSETNVDAAVRFGLGNWPGLHSVLIHQSLASPVCAPKLVAGMKLPISPKRIAKMNLSTTKNWRSEWPDWMAAAGHKFTGDEDMVEHDNRAFSFDSALAGNSVILADLRLTATDVAAGNLVRLHPVTLTQPQGTYVVFPTSGLADQRVVAFADWMQETSKAQNFDLPV